jgi:GNAT superfamily N-acetyltransferase
VLAAADTRAFERWGEAHWWPALRDQYPVRQDRSPDAEIIRLLHRPPRADDDVIESLPAHLHIDLLERVRGLGYGRILMGKLLDELRDRRTPGVHLDVARDNANAIAFYEHLGFEAIQVRPDALLMGLRLGP